MGNQMSDGDKVAVGVAVAGLTVVGAMGLYYLIAGFGRENNAALIPDAIEDRIDHVVEALNSAVGKGWVTWGADQLKSLLRKSLPAPLVSLIDVVYAVERESQRVPMSCSGKRECAKARAIAWGIA